MEYPSNYRIICPKNVDKLESGFYPVGEIALRCGFDDVSCFCRYFKKHTGLTPLAFTQNGI